MAGHEELANLLACYLGQDFVDDYGSPQGAVDAYRREAEWHDVRLAAGQSAVLRSTYPDDAELWSIMLGMGIGYYPQDEGWTAHEWLVQLESWLRSHD